MRCRERPFFAMRMNTSCACKQPLLHKAHRATFRRMKPRSSLLAIAALTSACATVQSATIEDRTLSHGCSDTIVVGRIKNGEYKSVKNDEDILGHGWIDAHAEVKRLVRGGEVPSSLPIKYYAHTYMREDRDFMLVLSGSHSAGFELRHAQLMSVRPRIAAKCDG